MSSGTKVVVVKPDGGSDTYVRNDGQWVVDDNGTLHVRDGNHVKAASYATGAWTRVRSELR